MNVNSMGIASLPTGARAAIGARLLGSLSGHNSAIMPTTQQHLSENRQVLLNAPTSILANAISNSNYAKVVNSSSNFIPSSRTQHLPPSYLSPDQKPVTSGLVSTMTQATDTSGLSNTNDAATQTRPSTSNVSSQLSNASTGNTTNLAPQQSTPAFNNSPTPIDLSTFNEAPSLGERFVSGGLLDSISNPASMIGNTIALGSTMATQNAYNTQAANIRTTNAANYVEKENLGRQGEETSGNMMTGTMLGSMFGPVGSVAGALIGALSTPDTDKPLNTTAGGIDPSTPAAQNIL